jgi:hypothetical protein
MTPNYTLLETEVYFEPSKDAGLSRSTLSVLVDGRWLHNTGERQDSRWPNHEGGRIKSSWCSLGAHWGINGEHSLSYQKVTVSDQFYWLCEPVTALICFSIIRVNWNLRVMPYCKYPTGNKSRRRKLFPAFSRKDRAADGRSFTCR